ncbi:histidine phosphatase family protein [Aminiphilus circumscriptus]|uniref:histidine phosphatase family protein n=1 Tax=Aminiphilus circumscriptus TaxID=290732 RepID=UPI000492802D|nr:histidine phosphatase family protein [Aminiphilus circumscriptus]
MKEQKGHTTIILIRHGECAGNREGLFRGRRDFPLNETGQAQAKALAREMMSFAPKYIYTSPLSRATETAEAIAHSCGALVDVREGFNNMALGPWEGAPKETIRENFPVEWELWLTNPERLRITGAERLADVQRRAFSNLEHLVHLHKGDTIAIVTHRAVLKPLLAAALGIAEPYFWRIHTDTASYSLLTHDLRRGYCCTLLNQTRHLAEYISEWV